MKKLCPNLDRHDGLETVLEVPMPEEIFGNKNGTTTTTNRAWQNMKSWVKPNVVETKSRGTTEIQLLMGVVGAPLIPFPIDSETQHITGRTITKHHNIEASMAKYIVKQYVAAVGGENALNAVESMYAMGEVRVGRSEFEAVGEGHGKKVAKKVAAAAAEMVGGFVVWQKRPELWCLELVVSGYKISAGSDGKVAWRQTPWHNSHASRGPPRPLRRLFQGLDPRSTANVFNKSTCIGEKSINKEECFTLKVEAEATSLRARSSCHVEIVRHTMWGHFSQKTGLLVQLQDTYLLKLKSPTTRNGVVFWETTMESHVHDYRHVDGILIAHAGRTRVTLSRFGGGEAGARSRTRMEERWKIEEVDFNIKGLSMDCFLAPSDLDNRDYDQGDYRNCAPKFLPDKIRSASFRIAASSKVLAFDDDNDGDSTQSDDDE